MPREGETMPEAMWLESRKALSKGRVHISDPIAPIVSNRLFRKALYPPTPLRTLALKTRWA